MPDPFQPPLTNFNFSEEEQSAIDAALATEKPWDHEQEVLTDHKDVLVQLKVRVRDFHLQRHGHSCCYCAKNFEGEFTYVLDREHILPKDAFHSLAYTLCNLGVACKKCNMRIKGTDTSFVFDIGTILSNYDRSDRYLFIHPNFDRFSDHIAISEVILDENKLIAYKALNGSLKGGYHYNYFKLSDRQIESLDQAQGLSPQASDVAKQIFELSKQYLQSR